MGQQLQSSSWRGGSGERLWLSGLIEAMEETTQAARRGEPCDRQSLAALRAQLSLPAKPRFTSPFSLRN